MMKYLFSIILLITWSSYSQNTLSFSYDSAGNQTVREIICINCNVGGKIATESSQEENLEQSKEHTQISFYPNPVQEELYIKWINEDGQFVTSIDVYSLQGQMVYTQQNLSETDNTTVAFQNYAQGVYSVLLIYNNNEKKALKVIKK